MGNTERISIIELPITFWDLKCRDCQIFKDGKAYFLKDWNGILRIECEKLGNLRLDEWHFRIKNCTFFKP